MEIKFKISITNGRIVRDFYVKEDKAPGGLKRMQDSAFQQAAKSGDFERGDTLNIVSNWHRRV